MKLAQPRLLIMVLAALFLHSRPALAQWNSAPPDYEYNATAGCPIPAKIYAPCEDQMQRFLDAAASAQRKGRFLVIVFGADWCPYCRSFNTVLPGGDVLGHEDFKDKADHINIAVSAISAGKKVDIESGYQVLRWVASKAAGREPMKGIPFIAVIDPRSANAATLNTTGLEISELWAAISGSTYDPAKVRAAIMDAIKRLQN